MRVRRFFDTNILIYAFAKDDPRAPISEALIAEGGYISVQVLNEFVNVAHRKLGATWPEVRIWRKQVLTLVEPPSSITLQMHERALAIAEKRKLSFYDALIISAAIEADCDRLLSEDMQHGQKIDGVRIENPFR